MNSPYRLLIPLFVFGLLVFFSLVVTAEEVDGTEPKPKLAYASQRIEVPGSKSSVVYAVNNKGDVAGIYRSKDRSWAFASIDGEIHKIKAESARDINDSGAVVGYLDLGTIGDEAKEGRLFTPYRWTKTGGMDVTLLNGTRVNFGKALRINNREQIAIQGILGGIPIAVRWDFNGDVEIMGNLHQGRFMRSEAHVFSMSEKGGIVGLFNHRDVFHPFLWHEGRKTGAPAVSKRKGKFLNLNAKHHLAGFMHDDRGRKTAFLLKDGETFTLAIPQSVASEAKAIANDDTLAGVFTDKAGQDRGFIWKDEYFYYLNEVAPQGGWLIEEARDINDKGQIVANMRNGDSTLGLLLTPIEIAAE